MRAQSMTPWLTGAGPEDLRELTVTVAP